MISVAEADQIIRDAMTAFPVVTQSLTKSYGCVLQEDLVADRDLPPFHKSMMDGIAIVAAAYQKGTRRFPIEGIQSAGKPQQTLCFDHACFEIMTGAVVPEGCDCVIPIERVQISDGKAQVEDGLELSEMQHIRPQGADHKQGRVLVTKGSTLGPVQVATAAAIGKAELMVSQRPRIALISNGDELVDIDAPIEPYQIRRSNSYFMQAALRKVLMYDADLYHFRDDLKVLRKQIGAILENYDVVILTGGVSMGKFDLIPQVLDELGVKALFHKVSQKPGKPFWFGQRDNGTPVFALPGNPVSTQVGLYRHVIPNLRRAAGEQVIEEFVRLSEDYTPSTKFTYFCPVQLRHASDEELSAKPCATGGSGDFASMANTDGFVELTGGQQTLKGTRVRLYRW